MTASKSLALPVRANEPAPARRLLVSISLVLGIAALGFIPLPGVDIDGFMRFTNFGWLSAGNLSIGATAFGPIVSGFVLVFFGPYIPIEILVHAGEEERAAAIVERILDPN